MNYIIFWVLIILTFFLGFLLGIYKTNPDEIAKLAQAVKRRIIKQKLGAIQKPTPQEIAKRGTIQEQTEKAMEETLEKII